MVVSSGYGTFASGNYNETSTAQRNWLRHQTIINGATARGGNPAYTVVGVGVDGATLDGFFVQGGNANATISSNPNGDVGETFRGGGMFILTRTVTVRNCWFRNNNAGIAGGAVTISTCYTGVKTVLFKDCVFQSNTCQRVGTTADIGLGGAMNILRSSPTIDGCIFFSNTGRYGGAIYSVWSDNSAAGAPNGTASETPIIRNSLFYGNTAQEAGGAIYCHNSNALITHCTITSNGGGASAFEVPVADQGGGFVASNVPILPRVSVPGAGTADPGNANLQNNFFAGNTGGSSQIIARSIGTSVTLSQTTNIQNAGVGMFQDAGNRDYRLQTGDTIALNRATPTAQTPPQDGFGVTRPNGAINGATANDAGAYERDSQNPAITTKTANKVLDANGEALVYIDDVLNTATDNDTSLVYSLTSIGTVANAATYGTIVNYATVTSAQLFTCANIGANSVTLYAMDNDGRLVSATATVNISENTPPVLVTANPSPVNVGSGSANVPAASFVSNVSDNCGGTITTLVRR
ncbi:MAG: hypothetical protein HC888_19265, partial [Candidatus Competibacteraceae bacterium]|nr:hypothetical protein [Candidatus Competibacteraceae bacterium]